MGLVDDLNRLSDMHAAGQLSDEEFDEAKTRMIRESTGTLAAGGDTAGGMATSTVDPVDPVEPGPRRPGPTTNPSTTPPTAFPTTTTVTSLPVGTSPGVMPGSYGARPVTGPVIITAGPFSGAVVGGSGSIAPTTRLKNRAQGVAAPSSVEPQRSAVGTFVRSLLWLMIPILFVALMVSTAGVAIFPGLARLTAPILCDPPFDHSYVDITSSNPVPGETYIEWELQCYNDRGTVEAANDFDVMKIMFLGTTVALMGLTILLILLFRMRRALRGGSDPTARSGSSTSGFADPDDINLADMGGSPIVNPPS